MLRVLQQFILTTLFAVFASQASAMFIQADWFDPTQPGVGTNRYSYSFNDPINLSDPNGNHVVQDENGDLFNDSNGDGEHNLDDHVQVGNINDISEKDLFGEFERDDQRSLAKGRYDPIEYYRGSFGSDLTNGRFNPQALSPIHPNNGQAANADNFLYGLATLPASIGLNSVKGTFAAEPQVAAALARAAHNTKVLGTFMSRNKGLVAQAKAKGGFKQALDHAQRLADFARNPTTRSSMSKRSKESIRAQQIERVMKLEQDMTRNMDQSFRRISNYLK